MTYSEIVQLLSSQLTTISDDNPRTVPLLEKYVNQMQLLRDLNQNNDSSASMQQRNMYFNQDDSEAQFQQKYFEFFGNAEKAN